jgi:curli biogenesis system outer membrane secretion channel CsgG
MNSRLSCCGVLLVAMLFCAGCHHDEPATLSGSPAAPSTTSNGLSANASETLRQKPDFGGVGSEHVEVTATGPNLEAAVDNAVRMAIEQVRGKSMTMGSTHWSGSSGFQGGDDQAALQSRTYSQWVASHSGGVVTHFQILSQQQVHHAVHSDEESLQASQGESWNRGSVDASASLGAKAEAGKARAGLDADASLQGQWDQKQGASKLDYHGKHTDYASEWQVRIAADVATYHESADAKLTRVVVAMPRTRQAVFHVGDRTINARTVAQNIRAALTEALAQTHRFTVLDRDSNAEINSEIELIQSGMAKPSDTARLVQQLATDLIVIPTIERFEYLRHERHLRMSDRVLASYSGGGRLGFQVVNATTGQIVLSQSFDYAVPATAPTTLGTSVDGSSLSTRMMDALDRKIIAAILQSTYPPSILQLHGNQVVINQGEEAVTPGATYRVVQLGDPVIDPQSGLSLGPTEVPCCTVTIDRVTPKLSYGHIVEADFKPALPMKPGSMELREQVAVVTGQPATTPVVHRKTTSQARNNTAPKTNRKADQDKDW